MYNLDLMCIFHVQNVFRYFFPFFAFEFWFGPGVEQLLGWCVKVETMYWKDEFFPFASSLGAKLGLT